MNRRWWQLPGPSKFIDQVEREARSGNSVFIELPKDGSEGLQEAVSERLMSREFHLEELNLEFLNPEDKPLNLIYETFFPDYPVTAIRNFEGLLSDERFSRMAIWLNGMTERETERWWAFFERYCLLCRANPHWEFPVFIVPIVGEAPDFRGSVAATSLRLDNVTDRIDMMMFIGRLNPNAGVSRLELQVFRQMITELALWDGDLAEYISKWPVEDLFHPQVLLSEFATQKGWNSANTPIVNLKGAWRNGMARTVEDRLEWHSAWLAVNGQSAQLQRRLRAAQVSVLFPYLELIRHKLLHMIAPYISFPQKDERGFVIGDLYELEFKHIHYFMNQINGSAYSQKLITYVDDLRRIRNRLAHMDLLKVENIKLLANPPEDLAE